IGEGLAAPRADAVQDGDAAKFLQDEHARDARHGDAAENDDDEADQTQIVLSPIEVAADLVLIRSVRSRACELPSKIRAECLDQLVDALVRHLDQKLAAGAASHAEQ